MYQPEGAMSYIFDESMEDAELTSAIWLHMQMMSVANAVMNRYRHAGSHIGHKVLRRDFLGAHKSIMEHYFWMDDKIRQDGSGRFGPLYGQVLFERRFRMPRNVFDTLFTAAVQYSDFIRASLRADATGRFGASPLQKVVAAMRCLAYSSRADSLDEYCLIGESTALLSLKEFCRAIVTKFSAQYLRRPTDAELSAIEKRFRELGFPGCIGSLDFSSWDWHACPRADQGVMSGREKHPVIRMEVIADLDLRVWHLAFGFLGSFNDINVLQVSPLFLRRAL